MTWSRIDLNADLGEGIGDDIAMLDVVTSANIACGFHAGDMETMARTVAAAFDRLIVIGAHVSYPDREGFGRRAMDMRLGDLAAVVTEQITALDAVCRAAGTRVRYVKPHGALYNRIVHDEAQAAAVVEAVAAYHGAGLDGPLAVMGLPGSVVLRLAAARGLPAVTEAFPDRGYLPDGTLVPRDQSGALIADPAEIARRAVDLAVDGAVDGLSLPVRAGSLCLHGDSPGAVAAAHAVRTALDAAGVALRPFLDAAG